MNVAQQPPSHIPDTFTHQDELLTIDTNISKFLEGLLHPGIKAHPLFLDPHNGVWVLRVKFACPRDLRGEWRYLPCPLSQ